MKNSLIITTLLSFQCLFTSHVMAQGNTVSNDIVRTWQYRPDGQDFVCVNGNNRYTRALYGSHAEDRLDTSDRPVFCLYKAKDSRNLSFRINSVALDSTDYCEARYTAGKRTYTLTDKRWGDGFIKLTVLAYPDRQGGIFKFEANGFYGDLEIEATMCDIANQKLHRWGDMGCEKHGSLEADPKKKNLQTLKCQIKSEPVFFTVKNQKLSVEKAEKDFAKAEESRKKLASRVVFDTPDPYINTLGGVLTTAADGTWDDATGTVMHGAIGWRMPLPGWRGAYCNDFLGWDDRAVTHFDAYAASQVTNVPCTMPYATQDSAQNLSRGVHKWGTTIYSNGYICRSPHRNNQMHHYDMNLNYIDELLWHFSFDADTAYLRKMWPVITRHIAWEKQAFDGDGDGLYDAYAAIWASDGLFYNSGGGAHSSAYNYRCNKMAARIAEILGDDPKPYEQEAEHILNAMNTKLWMKDKGCWAEYVDFMGLKRRHESAALWTVYTPIDSYSCTPEQAYKATRWVDDNSPHIPIIIKDDGAGYSKDMPKLSGTYYTLSTTNWMPYDWSTNNVALAEVMHTALAYFLAGRADDGFQIMKGNILDEMYLGQSPANLGQISTYDAARGEMYRDFADNVGTSAKCIMEGLWGIQPDALNGKCIIRPGFPESWDSASVKTPYIEYSFRRENGKDIYDITQNFKQPLQIVFRQNTGNGEYKETVCSSDKHQHVVLETVVISKEDIIARTNSSLLTPNPSLLTPNSTLFDDVQPSQCKPVDIRKSFNANVTDVYKNEYTTPASPYTTLRIPKTGYGEWCHPLVKAETNDSVFRSLIKNGIYTAHIEDGKTIPFYSIGTSDTPHTSLNIIYTSLWDNYPDSVTINLGGKAEHAYLMMAGTTNQMQSRIANGVIVIEYTDGTRQETELVNPDNWCPIEQDYYVDDYAFKVSRPRPYRVHFMSDKVSRDLGKALNIGGVYERTIKGGAAELLDIKLNKNKKLRSLTVRTLSNDVVIGLMAVTLQ